MKIFDEFILKILTSDFPRIIFLLIVFILILKLYNKKEKIISINTESNTLKPQKPNRCRKIVVILTPIFVAYLSVLFYQKFSQSTFKEYVLFGSVSIAINLFITFAIAFLFREHTTRMNGNYVVTTAAILTTTIPFFLYYVFLSILLSGFKFPFHH